MELRLFICLVILSLVNAGHIRQSTDCTEAPDTGPCEASTVRSFFNINSKECEEFFYGGCGGNDNNYKTLEDCQRACIPYCALPSDSGPCRGYFERYFYSTSVKACKLFVYGGCRGNANKFQTLADCQRACQP